MLNQFRFDSGQFDVVLDELIFTGTDVRPFFQNQSTFDMELLTPGLFHLASFLDPQGRLECFGWLANQNGQIRYLIPQSLTERTLARLNRFLISEDVEISAPVSKEFWFSLGPTAIEKVEGEYLTGVLFDEVAYLQTTKNPSLPVIPKDEVDLWRALSGWPKFDGSDFSNEILNNLRLFDLSLIQNKGCYPGQETVSKIATRRGAAYGPVLIELKNDAPAGEIINFEKKIGKSHGCYFWNDKYYLVADLLRDFRVEKLKIYFSINGQSHEGIVKYYPLLSGNPEEKALELFYEGTDHFKEGDLGLAEEKLKKAIKINPRFADAYESLGVMLGRLNRFEEAIELMQELSRVNPKSVLAHTNMSLFLMRLGKIEEAEEQKSLATVKSFQSFGDEAKAKENEALINQKKQSEWLQRESMFKQVLEIDPEDTLANYGLGSIAVEKEDWQVAKDHLNKVIEQDPKYSVAYLALGKAYKGLGSTLEARKVWNEGIKIAASKGDLMPANQMQSELERL